MLFANAAAAMAALEPEWRWPNFSIAEFACRCGGRYCDGAYWHEPAFLDGLQAMRAALGQPMRITSGHRCPQWNGAVGGAALSQHKRIAADISLYGHNRFEVFVAAKEAGFTGLGLARSFLHVDRRPRAAHWYYRGSRDLWRT
jgi:hypothetical protein